jgi:hypothetical protein
MLLIIGAIFVTTWNTCCFGQAPKKPEIKVGAPQFVIQSVSSRRLPGKLQDEVKAIGSREATVTLPSGIYEISRNLTIPNNIYLKFERGAVLYIANGVTLTLNCMIDAGPFQIFRWAGTGRVIFKRAVASEMPLRWWGAKGDGVTDDTAAIQKAFNTVDNAVWPGIPCKLIGIPTDTYLVETVTFSPASENQYVLCGNGATLKQKSTNTILQLKNRMTVYGWKFIGSNRKNYAGSGIQTYNGGGHIYDCLFEYLDKPIDGPYAIYGIFENLEMKWVGHGVYITTAPSGIGNPNVVTLRDLKIGPCTKTAVFVQNSHDLRLERLSIEGARKDVVHLVNCGPAILDSCYFDALGADKDPAYVSPIRIENCNTIKIADSVLSTYGSGLAIYKSSFYFCSNSRNILVENCGIYAAGGAAVYSTDNTVQGVRFSHNMLTNNWTKNYIPDAEWDSNTPMSNGCVGFSLPVGMVKQGVGGGTEVENKLYTYAVPLSTKGQLGMNNCTAAIDNTTGFDDKNSLKISFTGQPASFLQYNLFGPRPRGNANIAVLSMFLKSDIDQTVGILLHNIAETTVRVKGDGKWYYVCFISNPRDISGATGFKINSNASSGHLWVDCVSLRGFSNQSEAIAWAGKVALPK